MRIIINYKTREGRKMLNRFVYDVYDNKTDIPIIIGGSAAECAKALGIKLDSFRSYIKKHRCTRYTVIKSIACELDDSFSARLKKARRRAGISQEKLAHLAQISWSSVRSYEEGRHKPDIETAAKLSQALGISIRYLAGEKKGY